MHRFIILGQGVWWGRGDPVPVIINISTIITNINNIITTTTTNTSVDPLIGILPMVGEEGKWGEYHSEFRFSLNIHLTVHP